MTNRIRLFVVGVALVAAASLAAPANAVPRDPVLASDTLEATTEAPPLPQLDREGAGLACGRTVTRCSIDFHDAAHRLGRFCLRVVQDGRKIATCMEPAGFYGQLRAKDVPEYRTGRTNVRPDVAFRCSTGPAEDRRLTTTCTLNLHRAAPRFQFRLFLNGRWEYAVRWWPESGRMSRVA